MVAVEICYSAQMKRQTHVRFLFLSEKVKRNLTKEERYDIWMGDLLNMKPKST